MSDVKVSVSLTLDDSMSAEASKSLRDLVAAADKTGRANKSAGDAARGAGKAAAQAGREGATQAGRYAQELRAAAAHNRAAATAARAGARAEKERSAALEKTAASAARAAKGAREQLKAAQSAARAQQDLAAAVRRTDGVSLSRLSRTMDALTSKGRALRANFGSFARNAGMGIAQGIGQRLAGAAGSVSLRPAMEYERRLAMMSNTAFAERDLAGRKAGMQELRAAVHYATQKDVGGGTRDAAAEALDKLVASGVVSVDNANAMLPTIQRFATASGSQSSEIAQIAISGLKQGFFAPEQIGDALNMALVAGQEGGFELKDMARWLPQLMGSAQGMKGLEGFRQILAASQSAVATAGSTDEAGNNLVNLLSKLNSAQLSDALKKEHNINLAGTLAAAREKGQLPLDAFIELLNREVVGKDKRFQTLKARAAGADGTEKTQALADMTDIIQASAIGNVLADRQASMALTALLNDPAYFRRVFDATGNAQGAVDTNFALVQATASANAEAAGNAVDEALQKTFDKVAPAFSAVAQGVTAAAEAFPAVTTAATAAAAALGSLAAFAGVGYLMRGRAGAASGAAGGAASRAVSARRYNTGRSVRGGSASAGGAAAASGLRSAAARGRIGGGAAIAAFGAYDALAVESDESLSRAEKNASHMETAGGLAGSLALGAAGAKAGALAGTAVGGPVGTLIGAIAGLIGSIGGYYLGSWLGRKGGDAAFASPGYAAQPGMAHAGASAAGNGAYSQIVPTTSVFGGVPGAGQFTPITVPAPQVTNHIRVSIDGRDVLSAMEERLERLGNRGD